MRLPSSHVLIWFNGAAKSSPLLRTSTMCTGISERDLSILLPRRYRPGVSF
jgi:hypothetical protein